MNLDINAGMVENNFDGDGGKRGDFIVGATLGVAYKFKEREWKAPVMPVVEPVMSKYSDQEGDALVAQLKDANNKIANLEQQLADAQKQQPVAVEQAEETPCATIYFSADRSDVTRKDLTILKALAKVMKANENTKYVVTGYADNKTGSLHIMLNCVKPVHRKFIMYWFRTSVLILSNSRRLRMTVI